MKMILKFDSEVEDDIHKHMLAVKSVQLSSALWDMSSWLWQQKKYDENLTEDQINILEQCLNQLNSLLKDYDIENLVMQ